MTKLLLMAPAVYIAASVNFSILIFKLLGKGDPRNGYSGNAGTVNVIRQLGMFWGVVVFLLDMGRALSVAFLSVKFLPTLSVSVIGFVLILGNQKPMFHGFRGGKGVASYLGFLSPITPFWASISCLVWIFAYALFREPFIGSFFMITALGLGTMVHYSWSWVVTISTSLTMAFIFFAHRPNIVAWRSKIHK